MGMSVGMLITAAAAWAIAGLAVTGDATSAAVNADGQLMMVRPGEYLSGLGALIYTSPLRFVVMFAPLAFIFFGWGAVLRNASAAMAQFAFFVFASLIGVSLSSIFLVYIDFSIVQTFLVTAIAFAGLSLYGYTTKRDLSGMGTFLMMGVIGLLVAIIVNMFLQSGVMMMAISAIGVLIFAGLTALMSLLLDFRETERDFQIVARVFITGYLDLQATRALVLGLNNSHATKKKYFYY